MSRSNIRRVSIWSYSAYRVICLLVLVLSSCQNSQRVSLTISAAASLQGALGEIETAYFSGHPKVEFRNNFDRRDVSSRIEQGAPVDVFLSAAGKPMDDLENKGLITEESAEYSAQFAGPDCAA